VSGASERANREYVRILHLAATTSEAEVETALQIVHAPAQAPLVFAGACSGAGANDAHDSYPQHA